MRRYLNSYAIASQHEPPIRADNAAASVSMSEPPPHYAILQQQHHRPTPLEGAPSRPSTAICSSSCGPANFGATGIARRTFSGLSSHLALH